VKIWGDKWVPQLPTFKIQSPCNSLPTDAMFAELIDPVGGGVECSVGEVHFQYGGSCNQSRYNQHDKLIWRAANSGMFTVQSAYFLKNDKKSVLTGEGSHSSDHGSTWKEIWSLQVPNSVKMFLWRACKDILPTKENLFKRKVLKDAICMFCSQEVESTMLENWLILVKR
jgi:hypothetical protein